MLLGETPAPLPGGVSTSDAGTPDWVKSIAALAAQGMSLWQQIQLQDMNMDLIRQGKPPLTASQMASMAPQLNIGVAKDTQMAMLIGLGAIGLFGLMYAGLKSRERG